MRKLLFIFAAMLLSSIGLHAENTITYEATARLKLWGDQLLDPGATTFGPAITSHEFSNGKGTITCSGEITQIGDSAFVHCTGLTSITIPNSVTTIGDHAFDGCTGLTSITIPNSVTTIGDNAFSECTGLTSITIPNSVTTIGERAFTYCTGLPSITIPSSVTTIGNLAFHNCLGLTSVTVFWEDAQSIVSIDSNVFQGIADFSGPSGARLYVPTGTYNLYKQANVWKEFGSIMDPNACTITYTNPDRLTLDPYAFGRVIKDHMFSNGTGTIICSGDIKKIGKEAFYQCFNMSAINIPSSVITIDDFAFSRCASLTSFTIPSSVITIGGGAFSYCYSLKTIYCYAPTPPTLGTAVFTDVPQDELSVYVFDVDAYRQQWKQLKSECFKSLLPKDLEVDGINYQLFVSNGYKARVIKKNSGYTGAISIREQVTYKGVTFAVTEIAEKAFSDCSGLTSITIPDSVTTIGDSAFVHCTGLTTIVVASGNPKYDSRNCNAIIETATNTLIYGCQTTTKIPNTVTTIGANAFAGCTGLTSIDIPSSVTTIGDGAFSHCALGAVTLPVSVMQIGKRAFEYCEQLKSVKLPSNLTLIDEGTFQHTGLESVVIPVSVKRIENYAFYACPLNYVECIPETPPTLGSTNTFTKNDAAIVYVPTPEATMAYQSSDWKNYFTKICSYITYRQTSSNTVEVIDALPIDNKVEIPAMFASEGTFYKVTGIADSAFYEEDSLVSISLPPTIQYIGNNAFCECHRLKDINIEFTEDLQTIGNKAFYNTALDSIVIPESVQSLGRAAFAFNTLHYVSLPTGLKNIPDECFRNCYFGTEIIVPEGVETIGANSFRVPTNFEKVTLITLPSTLKEIKDYAFENRNELKEVICLAQDPPTLGGGVFTNKKTAVIYVPDRDVMKTYQNSSWKNYNFTFADLMAEENMKYLYEVAGNNAKAKEIAQSYCDSIRKATSTEQVRLHTAAALEKIDALTLTDYKQALVDSLNRYAKVYGENIEAMQIANQYGPRIINAIFRPDAEQLFAEAYMKITDIYELIKLKKNYKDQLVELAAGDNDLQKVATDYGALIDRAETKEDARALYERATMRMNINKQIKYDWNGGSVKVNNHTCTTTKGY